MKMEGAQCEQMSVIVVMAKEPGPHGCTLGGVLLLYHPPRPLGPGVFQCHFFLKNHNQNESLPLSASAGE